MGNNIAGSPTQTLTKTVRDQLNSNDANTIADAASLVGLGNVVSKIKAVFTGLTSSAAQVITSANALANLTSVQGIVLQDGEALPAIGHVVTLRYAAGPAIVTDAGGAAVAATGTYPGTVLLSDDGQTLTFSAAVTAYTIEYYPAPLPIGTVGAATPFNQSGPG